MQHDRSKSMGYDMIKGEYSPAFITPKWYMNFRSAYFFTKRKAEESPVFKTPEEAIIYREMLMKEVSKIKEKFEGIEDESRINLRAEEIQEEREAKQMRYNTVSEVVNEFSKFKPQFTELRAVVESEEKEISTVIEQMPPTKKGKRQIDNSAIALLENTLKRMPQTAKIESDKHGIYSPERQELHEQIAQELVSNAECILKRQKPIAVITAGIPGAGKSHFLKKYAPFLVSDQIVRLDADEIAMKLPGNEGWNSSLYSDEVSHIISQAIDEIGTPCSYDILYDGTMNKDKNYNALMLQLKRLGYEVFVISVEIPEDIARQRVLNRYKDEGRYVPLDTLKTSIRKGTSTYDDVINNADGYIIVNGQAAKVIEKHGKEIPTDRPYFDIKAAAIKQHAQSISRHMKIRAWVPATMFGDGGKIEVLQTSPKGAMFVTDGEKKTWIMPRQRRADGTYTPGVYKALKESKFYNENSKKAEKYPFIKIVKETALAYLIKFKVCFKQADFSKEIEFWLPKSAIVIKDNFVTPKNNMLENKINAIELYGFNTALLKQTKKAWGIPVTTEEYASDQAINGMIFFPKSMAIENNDSVFIDVDFIKEKLEEKTDYHRTGGFQNVSMDTGFNLHEYDRISGKIITDNKGCEGKTQNSKIHQTAKTIKAHMLRKAWVIE